MAVTLFNMRNKGKIYRRNIPKLNEPERKYFYKLIERDGYSDFYHNNCNLWSLPARRFFTFWKTLRQPATSVKQIARLLLFLIAMSAPVFVPQLFLKVAADEASLRVLDTLTMLRWVKRAPWIMSQIRSAERLSPLFRERLQQPISENLQRSLSLPSRPKFASDQPRC
jgi:hypothetical protein